MLRANLYEFGRDAVSDAAIALFPVLDHFIGTRNSDGIETAFAKLREILGSSGAEPVSASMPPNPAG
jgi:flagellum-specific ATP synthase